MRVIAMIEQPAVMRQILGHLGIPLPSRADRSPRGLANGLAVHEVPEWTYGPTGDDLPPLDPLAV